ncbi:VOC family protein [Pseudarthrobacter sp. N5]|uniref:VOC family protein n=1 Tax=Pseudarthrobacter sp. N5 TaxID=3418416 RepID=UPI003CF4553A
MAVGTRGLLHHIELWVSDLALAEASLGWLLAELGYVAGERWPSGVSYQGAGEYIVLEAGPDVLPGPHERCRPGLNHLAFHAGPAAELDTLVRAAADHGWTAMFADKYPFAGGNGHYAAYLENAAGFEVELVAEN